MCFILNDPFLQVEYWKEQITGLVEEVQRGSDLLPDDQPSHLQRLNGTAIEKSMINLHDTKMASFIVVLENEELNGVGRLLMLEAARSYGSYLKGMYSLASRQSAFFTAG